MTFAIKGHLEFQEAFPVISPEYINNHLYFPLFPLRHTRLQLEKNYSLRAPSIITNIKNTYPWLGIGHWIRLIQVPACHKEAIGLQSLEPLQILGGCGELGIVSVLRHVLRHAKITIKHSAFRHSIDTVLYQFLNVAIFLPGTENVSNYSAERFLNAKLQSPWSSVGGVQKRFIYAKRQYLEISFTANIRSRKS